MIRAHGFGHEHFIGTGDDINSLSDPTLRRRILVNDKAEAQWVAVEQVRVSDALISSISSSMSESENTGSSRRRRLRFLLAVACALFLLCAGGIWWLSSNSFESQVRQTGGRFQTNRLESSFQSFLRGLEGHDSRNSHRIVFQHDQVDDQWLMAHREAMARLSNLILIMRETPVTGAGLEVIRNSPKLVFLDLTGTPLADEDVDVLTSLPRVTQLYIGHTGISDAALADLSRMQDLSCIGIDSSQATTEGITGLATNPRLCGVVLLDADDRSLREVSQLSGLTSLELVGEGVTPASLPILMELTSLQSLTLYGAEFSADEINELQQALPNCLIRQQELEAFDRMLKDSYNDSRN